MQVVTVMIENKNYDDSKSKTSRKLSNLTKRAQTSTMGQDNFCYRGNETVHTSQMKANK